MSRIRVNSERSYDVVIAPDWRSELAHLVTGRSKVAVITSSANRSLVYPLPDISAEVVEIEVADGEAGKSLQSLLAITDALGKAGVTRSDLVVGIGGGAVTDIAGLAAATWLRGIDWIAIPTTVAGAVDAAIGGKTGANTDYGKNLFGVFHSPLAVVVDLAWFNSLSDRDFAAGLAEVIKCGFIRDASILELIKGKMLADIRGNRALVEYLVMKAIRVKAEVVSRDFRESSEREILNYGHTLGHAIEKSCEYSLRHGECVAIGMVFAAELAFSQDLISQELLDLHRSFLSSLNLPIAYPAQKWRELEPLLYSDKKTRGQVLRFVVLTGLAATSRVEGITSDELHKIYEKVSS